MNGIRHVFRVVLFLVRLGKDIRSARTAVVLAVLAGAASGLANTGLIVLINSALNNPATQRINLVWGFVGLCVLLPIMRLISNGLLTRLAANALLELRLQLCRRILDARLRVLEEVGVHRLLATLTDDVPTISGALANLPLVFMHSAIIIASCVYLGWLSWTLFLLVLACLVLAILCYQIPLTKSAHYFRLFREEWDTLVKHFRAVTEGAKELKLHRRRRQVFFDEVLRPTTASLARFHVAGSDVFMVASSMGHIIIFILIGLVLFGVSSVGTYSQEVMAGYVLTLLYIMVPLEVVLNRLPDINRASIAVEKIEKLGLSLTADTAAEVTTSEPQRESQPIRLEMVGVSHTYHLEKENSTFTCGPIDFTLEAGELVFLIGGNGSGKTTFAKLLVGLYIPEEGEIRLNGQLVTDQNREDYRQLFSVVFSDFFLFDSLLGLNSADGDKQAQSYLSQLQLNHKVQVKDGVLSATELSQGQRKRLALLTAYLEDRPIYIFDEWAADQDPVFKEIFYHQLLPDLQLRGKTVVVISHDDRYYSAADRLVKLDYGRVEYDRRVDSHMLPPPEELPLAATVFKSTKVYRPE